jgi:hypothetical protein
MWEWLQDIGKNFRDPLPGSTNYLGAYTAKGELKRASQNPPAENDASQHSTGLPPERQSDLRVMKDGQSVKTVSADLGIEISRVGAIVRLKEIEKEWIRKVSYFCGTVLQTI